MDFHDRIKADEGALDKLMRGIPGFAGFMAQESRRDADKLLREHLCAELDGTVEALEKVASEWSREGQIDLLGDLERVAGRLRRAGDKLRFADYGYTGFFDAVKIGEDDLRRFYDYDLSLREFIGAVNEQVAALAEADEAKQALADLDQVIEALADMIGERERVAAELVP